jgi:DedD protein
MSSLRSRERDEENESEITLSTASLIGLFLGLVLICGVFFGFGYSVGRRSISAVLMSSAPSNAAEPETSQRQSASTAQPEPPVVVENTPTENPPADGQPAPVNLAVAETPAQTPTPAPAHKPKADVPAGPTPREEPTQTMQEAGHVMVQVAAVVHEEDANLLVAALRQRGFSALVRTEPKDKLLHVQIGPYGSRADATAERQKLISDGYNAIIKQ